MSKFRMIDLTGKKFGRLTVIDINRYTGIQYYWNCKCECGNLKVVRGDHLRSGKIRSCGCLQNESLHKLWTDKHTTTHNMSKTRQFTIWNLIMVRCYCKTNSNYKHYGARGIKVCDKWHKFEEFWKDMQKGYSDNLSIDRINVNGDYEPNNCRWANAKQQARNRTNNDMYTYKGETLCISELSEKYNVKWSTLKSRLNRGWSIEKSIETPIRICKRA